MSGQVEVGGQVVVSEDGGSSDRVSDWAEVSGQIEVSEKNTAVTRSK